MVWLKMVFELTNGGPYSSLVIPSILFLAELLATTWELRFFFAATSRVVDGLFPGGDEEIDSWVG